MVLVEAAEAGRAAELAHREVQDRGADVRLFWQLRSDRRSHLLGVAQDHEPPALWIQGFDGERGHRREHLRGLVDEQDVELPKHRLGRELLARAVRRRADDDAALGAKDLGVDVFTMPAKMSNAWRCRKQLLRTPRWSMPSPSSRTSSVSPSAEAATITPASRCAVM